MRKIDRFKISAIRVSRSFAKFPMAESDPAKTGLAIPLAMALL